MCHVPGRWGPAMTHDDFVVGDESEAWKRVSKGVIASHWLERESDRVTTSLLHQPQCAGKGSKIHIWRSDRNTCENLHVCSGPAGWWPISYSTPAQLCIPPDVSESVCTCAVRAGGCRHQHSAARDHGAPALPSSTAAWPRHG